MEFGGKLNWPDGGCNRRIQWPESRPSSIDSRDLSHGAFFSYALLSRRANSFAICKNSPHKNDPALETPSSVNNFSLALARIDDVSSAAQRANAKAMHSVASPGSLGVGGCLLVGHDGLLLVLSQFLLFL